MPFALVAVLVVVLAVAVLLAIFLGWCGGGCEENKCLEEVFSEVHIHYPA